MRQTDIHCNGSGQDVFFVVISSGAAESMKIIRGITL